MTNIGLSIRVVDVTEAEEQGNAGADDTQVMKAMIQCDARGDGEWCGVAIYLKPVEGARFSLNGSRRRAYRRCRADEWYEVPNKGTTFPFQDLLILEDAHEQLVINARVSDVRRWGRELPLPR